MYAILLAVVLVLGYRLESQHPIKRLRLVRETGYNLYFRVAYTGFENVTLALLPASLSILIISIVNNVSASQFLNEKNIATFFQFILVISLSLFTTLITLCKIYRAKIEFVGATVNEESSEESQSDYNPAKQILYEEIMKVANDLEKMIIIAARDVTPLRILLPNGKVYIGYPRTPELDHGEVKYIELLPILSGYLNEEQQLVISRNYFKHYKECYSNDGELLESKANHSGHDNISQFIIILKVEDVKLLSYFSKKAFDAIEQQGIKKGHLDRLKSFFS